MRTRMTTRRVVFTAIIFVGLVLGSQGLAEAQARALTAAGSGSFVVWKGNAALSDSGRLIVTGDHKTNPALMPRRDEP